MHSIDSPSTNAYQPADDPSQEAPKTSTAPQNPEPDIQESNRSNSSELNPSAFLSHAAFSGPLGEGGSGRSGAATQQGAAAAAHQAITGEGVSMHGAGYQNIAPSTLRQPGKPEKAKYKEVGMVASALVPDAVSMSVPYLSSEQRESYRVSVSDGLLKDPNGQPLNTGDGSHMVVMDKSGKIYAGSSAEVSHHSSFLSGNPVAAAGMMTVEDGKVTGLYNESGHYQVPQDYFNQLQKELKKNGAQISPSALQAGRKYRTSKQVAKAAKNESPGGKPVVDYSQSTKESNSIPVGKHQPGQIQRLYPTGPKWKWF
jgi:hypothetical protein